MALEFNMKGNRSLE